MRPILIILPQDWTRPGWFLLPRCCYQSTVEQILKEEMWRIWKYSGNRWVLSPASSNMWEDHIIFLWMIHCSYWNDLKSAAASLQQPGYTDWDVWRPFVGRQFSLILFQYLSHCYFSNNRVVSFSLSRAISIIHSILLRRGRRDMNHNGKVPQLIVMLHCLLSVSPV